MLMMEVSLEAATSTSKHLSKQTDLDTMHFFNALREQNNLSAAPDHDPSFTITRYADVPMSD